MGIMAPLALIWTLAAIFGLAGALPAPRYETGTETNLDIEADGNVVGYARDPDTNRNIVRREAAMPPRPRGLQHLHVGPRAEVKPTQEDLEPAAMLDMEETNLFPTTGTVYGQAYYGNSGPQGAKGMRGVNGTQGPKGERGPQGQNAFDDESKLNLYKSNISKYIGSRGVAGYNGSAGPSGDMGPKGFRGQQGQTGATIDFSANQTALFSSVVANIQNAIISEESAHAVSEALLNSQTNALLEQYNATQVEYKRLVTLLSKVQTLEASTQTANEDLQTQIIELNANLTLLLASQKLLHTNLQTLFTLEQQMVAARWNSGR